MKIITVKDYQEMSQRAGELLINRVNMKGEAVLGLATGSTPEGMYAYIVEKYKDGKVSFSDVQTFNLDEYVGLYEDDPNSYAYYMKNHLFNHIDLRDENAHLPNSRAKDLQEECQAYEKKIDRAGKIDLQVLGIGLNGHIGFNEPGTSFKNKTQIVDLDESTRQANARFFNSIEEVPTQAITMGVETIMNSKEIMMLIYGEGKADTVARLLEGKVNEDFPASIIHQHPNVTIITDEAAYSKVK
ncbi:glucosamine-6-phosphate deaminase [Virgibacillus oceani]